MGDVYQDKDLQRGVKPYMELQPSGVVLLSKLEPELAAKAVEDAAPDRQITAWDKLGYEKRLAVCRECPVRPLDEPTCYLRFGNYPGMDAFRMGFLLTTEYAFRIDDEQLGASPFSFEHLDRKNGELPRDKVVQLMAGLEQVEINKRPEEMANQVFQVLAAAAGPGEEVQGAATDLAYMPFVDEFVSRYVYRDEPYSAEDARELLPYLETIAEANDWAIWDADEPRRRRPLIVFRNRIRSMIEGLKTAEKYGLEMYVSY